MKLFLKSIFNAPIAIISLPIILFYLAECIKQVGIVEFSINPQEYSDKVLEKIIAVTPNKTISTFFNASVWSFLIYIIIK